jgi:hypothetical protein
VIAAVALVEAKLLDSGFAQNVILLGLTALLSGLLIPYVLKRVDYRKTIQQKEREAELAHQAKVIEAEAKFLDDISAYLWAWRYLSMKVAYYGANGAEDRYAQAEQEYDEKLWDVFNATRNEISRSRRLVADVSYRRLVALYEDDMVRLDKEILAARSKADRPERTEAFFNLNKEIYETITSRIDEVLNSLATELRLNQTVVARERE